MEERRYRGPYRGPFRSPRLQATERGGDGMASRQGASEGPHHDHFGASDPGWRHPCAGSEGEKQSIGPCSGLFQREEGGGGREEGGGRMTENSISELPARTG